MAENIEIPIYHRGEWSGSTTITSLGFRSGAETPHSLDWDLVLFLDSEHNGMCLSIYGRSGSPEYVITLGDSGERANESATPVAAGVDMADALDLIVRWAPAVPPGGRS